MSIITYNLKVITAYVFFTSINIDLRSYNNFIVVFSLRTKSPQAWF